MLLGSKPLQNNSLSTKKENFNVASMESGKGLKVFSMSTKKKNASIVRFA